MSTADSSPIIVRVKKWAMESGLEATTVSDERHDFALKLFERENLPELQIIHHKKDTAFVLVVGFVRIPENDRETLRNLKLEKFDELIWDIKLNLLDMGIDFIVLGAENDPDAWEVQKRLFLNEANVDNFYEAYSKVKKALISVIWHYKRALGSPS